MLQKNCFMIIELVKYPTLTEKSVRLLDSNQYTFDVDVKLTKPQIKNLIEDAFQVNVIAVNTHRPPRKKKRLGYTQGLPNRLASDITKWHCFQGYRH